MFSICTVKVTISPTSATPLAGSLAVLVTVRSTSGVSCVFVSEAVLFAGFGSVGGAWASTSRSASGRSSYQLVQAGGMTLRFLHVAQDTPRDEVARKTSAITAK